MRRVIFAFVALILLVGIAGAQEKATESKGELKIAVVNLRKVVDNYKTRRSWTTAKQGRKSLRKCRSK